MPTARSNVSILDQAMGLLKRMQADQQPSPAANNPEPGLVNQPPANQATDPSANSTAGQIGSPATPPTSLLQPTPVQPQTPLEPLKSVAENKSASKSTDPKNPESKTADATSQKVRFPNQVEREKSKVAPGYYRPVPEQTLVEWDAPARPFKQRKKRFFTTVLIIALLVSLILFFAGQVLPVAVVVSVVFLVYVSAVIPPNTVHCKLTNYGLYLEKEAFAWYEMIRFWFDEKSGQEVVNIDLYRFPGRLTLVIDEDKTPSKLDFNLIFSEVILKEKPELTTFEKAAKWLQEKIPLE